jgi:hypothetical protein
MKARKAILILVATSTSALSTNCIFPPRLDGDWQSVCGIFESKQSAIKFSTNGSGNLIISKAGNSCVLTETIDTFNARYTYEVDGIRNCSSKFSTELVARYTFNSDSTSLQVERGGLSSELKDCKRYPKTVVGSI